ncbi:hypothetical protein UY3_07115 [Chelonia mydas]|uniref:Uncharacterized protein n=1 Tax=Chelonia mydas TaxID=8469 RepID=M7BUE4_CHEMY|nr:hypothetical protein UY3_07115 [Chelonia mydas]
MRGWQPEPQGERGRAAGASSPSPGGQRDLQPKLSGAQLTRAVNGVQQQEPHGVQNRQPSPRHGASRLSPVVGRAAAETPAAQVAVRIPVPVRQRKWASRAERAGATLYVGVVQTNLSLAGYPRRDRPRGGRKAVCERNQPEAHCSQCSSVNVAQ